MLVAPSQGAQDTKRRENHQAIHRVSRGQRLACGIDEIVCDRREAAPDKSGGHLWAFVRGRGCDCEVEAPPSSESWTTIPIPNTLDLVEPLLDERAKSASGFLGVGAAYFDFEPSTALGTQRYQVEYALSMNHLGEIGYPRLLCATK